MKLDRNIDGEPMIRMGATEKELLEIIKLIDDEEDLDEEFLSGYRKKLANKLRVLRKELRS